MTDSRSRSRGRLSRRTLLGAGAGAVVGALTPQGSSAGGISPGGISAGDISAGDSARAAPATPARVLVAGPADAPLLGPDEPSTPTWCYDGTVPGPVLRYRRADTVRVRFSNALPQPSSVHWHGVRIDNAMDGAAGMTQAAVEPGGHFDYDFQVPDAGTFWYHSHHRGWEQLARGLYGLLIVDEPDPPEVDRELALVFDDWRIDEMARIHEASFGSLHDRAHAGRLGNVLTVNGTSSPDLPLRAGERLRLRLANTCNARVLALVLERHQPTLIALDGHPVRPRQLDDARVILAPGQRADLVLDATLAPGTRAPIRLVTRRETVDTAWFVYAQEGQASPAGAARPVAALAPWSLPAPDLRAARRIPLLMEGGAMGAMTGARHQGRWMDARELARAGRVWAFNGIAGDLDEPLVSVPRGESVLIEIDNATPWAHAMHLHGHHFQVVAREGVPVARPEWRDTVLVARDERLAIGLVVDNPGRWLLHCHMLEHQAAGMVTWLEVT